MTLVRADCPHVHAQRRYLGALVTLLASSLYMRDSKGRAIAGYVCRACAHRLARLTQEVQAGDAFDALRAELCERRPRGQA